MSLPAGADDLARHGARGALHALAPRRQPARGGGDRFRHRQPRRTCLRRASCCAASICPPARSRKRFALRRSSLTHLGRSAALLIGTRSTDDDDLLLTITAATPRPVQLRFDRSPSAAELRHAIDDAVPAEGWFDDVHGSAAYKRHLTYYYAEQIRAELAARSGGMNFAVNGRTFSAEPAPGQCLQHLPARAWLCSASRRAATRAIAAPAPSGSTACRSIPAWCRPSAPPGARSPPSRGSPSDGKLHPMQQAFLDAQAFQCGFCAAGMIMTAATFDERSARRTCRTC